MCSMMEISSPSARRAKHIHHPGNGGRASRSARGVLPFAPKGKTLYGVRVRPHPGAILQKRSRKWPVSISLFHFLSQFQTQKTNDLPQVSLGLCACCLRVNFPSLRRVRPQGRTFTSVCVCVRSFPKGFLFHLDRAVLRRHWDEL